MILSALVAFGILLLAWLVAPSDERRRLVAESPRPEPAGEPRVESLPEAA